MRIRNSQHGTGVFETMFASMLTCVFILGVTDITRQSQASMAKESHRIEMQQHGQVILDKATRMMRLSD